MEIEFWLESKSEITPDGLYRCYRVYVDIPLPCHVDVYDDDTNRELKWEFIPRDDQKMIMTEIEGRSLEYVEWSDEANDRLFDASAEVASASYVAWINGGSR